MTLILIIGNKNYSSWSLRPWLTLKRSGLAFEEIRIPLDRPDTAARIRAYSPSGRVPALRHDDLIVWESLAICEYIAELAPEQRLWPIDPTARATARAVSAEMHSGFSELRRQMPMDCRARRPRAATSAVQCDIDRIVALWQTCRQQFGTTGKFLFGDVSIADAMFAPVASRFVTYDVPLPAIAQAYVEAVWSLPAMQEWLSAAAAEAEVIDTDAELFADRNSS